MISIQDDFGNIVSTEDTGSNKRLNLPDGKRRSLSTVKEGGSNFNLSIPANGSMAALSMSSRASQSNLDASSVSALKRSNSVLNTNSNLGSPVEAVKFDPKSSRYALSESVIDANRKFAESVMSRMQGAADLSGTSSSLSNNNAEIRVTSTKSLSIHFLNSDGLDAGDKNNGIVDSDELTGYSMDYSNRWNLFRKKRLRASSASLQGGVFGSSNLKKQSKGDSHSRLVSLWNRLNVINDQLLKCMETFYMRESDVISVCRSHLQSREQALRDELESYYANQMDHTYCTSQIQLLQKEITTLRREAKILCDKNELLQTQSKDWKRQAEMTSIELEMIFQKQGKLRLQHHDLIEEWQKLKSQCEAESPKILMEDAANEILRQKPKRPSSGSINPLSISQLHGTRNRPASAHSHFHSASHSTCFQRIQELEHKLDRLNQSKSVISSEAAKYLIPLLRFKKTMDREVFSLDEVKDLTTVLETKPQTAAELMNYLNSPDPLPWFISYLKLQEEEMMLGVKEIVPSDNEMISELLNESSKEKTAPNATPLKSSLRVQSARFKEEQKAQVPTRNIHSAQVRPKVRIDESIEEEFKKQEEPLSEDMENFDELAEEFSKLCDHNDDVEESNVQEEHADDDDRDSFLLIDEEESEQLETEDPSMEGQQRPSSYNNGHATSHSRPPSASSNASASSSRPRSPFHLSKPEKLSKGFQKSISKHALNLRVDSERSFEAKQHILAHYDKMNVSVSRPRTAPVHPRIDRTAKSRMEALLTASASSKKGVMKPSPKLTAKHQMSPKSLNERSCAPFLMISGKSKPKMSSLLSIHDL